jgi:putative flippase GtrA
LLPAKSLAKTVRRCHIPHPMTNDNIEEEGHRVHWNVLVAANTCAMCLSHAWFPAGKQLQRHSSVPENLHACTLLVGFLYLRRGQTAAVGAGLESSGATMHQWHTFVGSRTPGYRRRRRAARGAALIALLVGFGAFYVLSEFLLLWLIHPFHWLAAGIGALVAYLIAYLWFLRRAYLSTRH